MKQKLFTSVACLILLVLMLFGSTLAWLTDQSDSVNTMVAGKISISQRETGANAPQVLMPSQTYTKTVTVTNTGTQPCFVRTIFAFEDNEYGSDKSKHTVDMIATDNAQIVIPGVTEKDQPKIQFTVKHGNNTTIFTVGYYIHANVLEVGTSITPLNTVTLSENADNDWFAAVDDCYELLILSQACQSTGMQDGAEKSLNTTFHTITGDNCALWYSAVLNGSDLYTPGDLTATVSGRDIIIAP